MIFFCRKMGFIQVIDTGGTFGMMQVGEGVPLSHAPAGDVEKRLRDLLAGTSIEIKYTREGPYDSSAMSPEHWMKLADIINSHEQQSPAASGKEWERGKRVGSVASLSTAPDGYVIIHGTDTLAYTSAALSFLLIGMKKPVILTGSQAPLLPPKEPSLPHRTDAINNFLGALRAAAWPGRKDRPRPLAGVYVFFNDLLLRGAAVVKVDSESFQAFNSPRIPPMGRMDGDHLTIDERLHQHVLDNLEQETFKVHRLEKGILLIHLFPGIDLRLFPLSKHRAVIIEAFGMGNGPTSDDARFKVPLKTFLDDGGHVAVVTECLGGRARDTYGTSIRGMDDRIALCANMTTPAAFAKASVLLANQNCKDHAFFVKEMKRSWKGEILYPSLEEYLAQNED
eukprot:m.10804 g.10804  ORF g.10804 m.10804 type:complete len:395 (-) comp5314_c0_seq1:303-1487(-)